MTYEEKLEIADIYLEDKFGICWDDLPDINSLHDCNTREEVIAACNDRLRNEGFDLHFDL